MMTFEEGLDFDFVERTSSELYSVRLLTSDWAGVIYTYGRVTIEEDKKNDRAVLRFNFRIEDPASFSDQILQESSEFKDHIARLLSQFLDSQGGHIGVGSTSLKKK